MVKRKECLAYEYGEWRFEWYVNEGGNSPALEYYHEKLDEDQKTALAALFDYLAICYSSGKSPNKEKISPEGDALFAFKPKPHRFLAFFVKGKTVIITHGFEKKRDKLPANEKKKAKTYRSDYELRTTRGNYYDEETKGVHKPT
jgi:hypothetical protein